MEKNTQNSGYCTITYKERLYLNHFEYLELTKKLYNEVILIYYNLLLENLDFLNLSNQYCLRELEKLTIKDRNGSKPKNYIDIELPTYFRRSAINQAIGHVRLYVTTNKHYEENKNNVKKMSIAQKFNASPVYYKGMYKNLYQNKVELKLWNGEKWNWYKATLKGREFDIENALSPTLVLNDKYVMIHIPVKEEIENVEPVKARMHKNEVNVLGISFSNYDNFVICVVLDKNGNFVKSKFIKGGDEYRDKTSKILALIKKHRQVNKKITAKDHKKYWTKLNDISTNTAHKASKKIVNFAKENGVTVIIIAKQEEANEYIVRQIGKYSPIYLRHKIINFLKYKAFKESILITEVRSNYTANRCYKCRAKIKKVGRQEIICESGHKANYYFNTAMNVGLMGLKKFGNIN